MLAKSRKHKDSLENELAELKKQIAEKRNKWEPKVNVMVTRINMKFKKFMEEMSFAGGVELIKNEDDPLNPALYSLGLSVQFRNFEVRENAARLLNAKAHSGGEKAVSTILFLLSLQALTPCPFRLVDEVNQGLDADNERRVFGIINRETSAKEAAQFFLITPKLLEGLEYAGDVSVLVVMNGPHLFLPIGKKGAREVQWNVGKVLARKQGGGAAASQDGESPSKRRRRKK